MFGRILMLGFFSIILSSCGSPDPSQDSELEAIPRDLIVCLKGGSCAGYKVANRTNASNFGAVFNTLWENYSDDPVSDNVKAEIGGNVNAAWITNTCVIRTSQAMNAAGGTFAIPSNFAGLETVKGKDGRRYAFRVVELAKYLLATYGRPQVTSSAGAIGHRGVILFDREGWSDANGHFDIWNGTSVKYSDYSSTSTNVFVWQ